VDVNEKSHWKEEKEGPGEMVFYVGQPNTLKIREAAIMEAAVKRPGRIGAKRAHSFD